MYGKNDLRVELAPDRKLADALPFKAESYARFYEDAPAGDSEGARTWYARGQNLIVAYSAVGSGATFAREEQVDEYVVLLPDAGMSVQATIDRLGTGDPGQGYQVARLEPGRVTARRTRHSNGGIDPSHWQMEELGPSLWGHDRDRLPPELSEGALRMRLGAAAPGVQAPSPGSAQ